LAGGALIRLSFPLILEQQTSADDVEEREAG